VRFIRQHGHVERYRGHRYTVLEVEDMKYWTMGWPAEQTTLINRTYVDDQRREVLRDHLAAGGTVESFDG